MLLNAHHVPSRTHARHAHMRGQASPVGQMNVKITDTSVADLSREVLRVVTGGRRHPLNDTTHTLDHQFEDGLERSRCDQMRFDGRGNESGRWFHPAIWP